MAFDPDAYLAGTVAPVTQQPAFDPDAYLGIPKQEPAQQPPQEPVRAAPVPWRPIMRTEADMAAQPLSMAVTQQQAQPLPPVPDLGITPVPSVTPTPVQADITVQPTMPTPKVEEQLTGPRPSIIDIAGKQTMAPLRDINEVVSGILGSVRGAIGAVPEAAKTISSGRPLGETIPEAIGQVSKGAEVGGKETVQQMVVPKETYEPTDDEITALQTMGLPQKVFVSAIALGPQIPLLIASGGATGEAQAAAILDRFAGEYGVETLSRIAPWLSSVSSRIGATKRLGNVVAMTELGAVQGAAKGPEEALTSGVSYGAMGAAGELGRLAAPITQRIPEGILRTGAESVITGGTWALPTAAMGGTTEDTFAAGILGAIMHAAGPKFDISREERDMKAATNKRLFDAMKEGYQFRDKDTGETFGFMAVQDLDPAKTPMGKGKEFVQKYAAINSLKGWVGGRQNVEIFKPDMLSKPWEALRAPEPPAAAPVPPGRVKSPVAEELKASLARYEDTGDITFDDMVNQIDGIEGTTSRMEDAVSAYRDAREDDRKLKGRGDMEDAENQFLQAVKQEIGSEEPEESPRATLDKIERRIDAGKRKAIEQMTPEEMAIALKIDELTGLGSKRALEDLPENHAPVWFFADVDGLKWANDNLGYEVGDKILNIYSSSIKEAGLDAYRPSGDEVKGYGKSKESLDNALKNAYNIMGGKSIEMVLPSGEKVTLTNMGFSYGLGEGTKRDGLDQAERSLHEAKSERERLGIRAKRGEEPSGVLRTRPTGKQVDVPGQQRQPEIVPSDENLQNTKYKQAVEAATARLQEVEDEFLPEGADRRGREVKAVLDVAKEFGVDSRRLREELLFLPVITPKKPVEPIPESMLRKTPAKPTAPIEQAVPPTIEPKTENATPDFIGAAYDAIGEQYGKNQRTGFRAKLKVFLDAKPRSKAEIIAWAKKHMPRSVDALESYENQGVEQQKVETVSDEKERATSAIRSIREAATRKDAKKEGWSQERTNQELSDLDRNSKSLFESLDSAVKGKDIKALRDMVHPSNEAWRAGFEVISGKKLPKSVKGSEDVLRDFIGPEEYDKYWSDRKDKFAAEQTTREEKTLQSERDAVLNEKIRTNISGKEEVMTNREMVDKLIENGYTTLKEITSGKFPVNALINEKTGRLMKFKKKHLVDYIRDKLASKEPEKKIETVEPPIQTETIEPVPVELEKKPAEQEQETVPEEKKDADYLDNPDAPIPQNLEKAMEYVSPYLRKYGIKTHPYEVSFGPLNNLTSSSSRRQFVELQRKGIVKHIDEVSEKYRESLQEQSYRSTADTIKIEKQIEDIRKTAEEIELISKDIGGFVTPEISKKLDDIEGMVDTRRKEREAEEKDRLEAERKEEAIASDPDPKVRFNGAAGRGLYHIEPPKATVHDVWTGEKFFITKGGAITDGHSLFFKGQAPKTAKALFDRKYEKFNSAENDPHHDETKIIPKDTVRAELQFYITTKTQDGDVAVFKNKDGVITEFSGKKIAYFMKVIPDFRLDTNSKYSERGANIYSGKKHVGVIMPLRYDNSKYVGLDFGGKPVSQNEEAPKPVAPKSEAPKPSKKTAEIPERDIEDFGEKIGGARKDYYADYIDKMEKARDVDIAAAPLSVSWPEPKYESLIESGKDPWIVGFIRAARDEIPTKPQRSYRLSRWVQNVSLLRGFSEDLLSGKISKERFLEKLNDPEFYTIRRDVGGRAELYTIFGHSNSLKGVKIAQHQYSIYRGEKDVSKWIISKEGKATHFSNMGTELGVGNTKEEAIEAFRAKYDTVFAEDGGEGRKTEFVIYQKTSTKKFYVGKKMGSGRYLDMKEFDTAKEALEYRKNNQAALEKQLDKLRDVPSERRDFNRERIGKDHRNGKDVTPEMFQEAFGFHGVEFGNWVNSDERQDNLNRAYDALYDLANILNVPTRAISLNGELGLGFGSRGHGGKMAAAAHYEPDKIVINLTRKNGAGSLAHEWMHAFDNYLSRKRGKSSEYMTETPRLLGATENISAAKKNKMPAVLSNDDWNRIINNHNAATTRPELVDAVDAVMKAIKKTDLEKRSLELDKTRTNVYWSQRIEMAARSFENYVISKLKDAGASNDYLANVATSPEYAKALAGYILETGQAPDVDMYPYLLDSEMEIVKPAFDNLVNTLKTREEEGNVPIFQRESEQTSLFDEPSSGNGLDVQAVEEIRDSFDPQIAMVVKVVPTEEDLPESRKITIARHNASGQVRALYDPDTQLSYLIADMLPDRDSVERAIAHEVYAHFGMRVKYGGQALASVYGDIYRGLPQNVKDRVIRNYFSKENPFDENNAKHRFIVVDEALASEAETIIEPSMWDRLVAAIREFLRRIGSVAKWTANDIKNLLLRARSAARTRAAMRDGSPIDEPGADAVMQIEPREQLAERWYSPTLRAVQSLKQDRGTGDQMFAMITKTPGVKEAEWKWIGLDDFLKGKKSVTKQEIDDFVRRNRVEIKEVQRGGNREIDRLRNRVVEIEKEIDRTSDPEELYAERDDAIKRIEELGGTYNVGLEGTKYHTYVLPGGENYREVLLTVPESSNMQNRKEIFDSYEERIKEQTDIVNDVSVQRDQRWNAEERRNELEIERDKAVKAVAPHDNSTFKSSHWSEPNVIAHIRLDDRTGPNGEKVLFVEEIQSDWAREARGKGILPKKITELPDGYTIEKGKRFSNNEPQFIIKKPDGSISWVAYTDNESDAIAEQLKVMNAEAYQSGVPAQPFLKNWEELTLKRVLRMAAEEGYDRVSWINGEQTAARYDLSKQISHVDYIPEDKRLIAYSNEGTKVIDEYSVEQEEVAEYIGKEPAKRLLEQPVTGKGTWNVEETIALGGGWVIKKPDGSYYETQPGRIMIADSKSQAQRIAENHSGKNQQTLQGEDLKIGGEWAVNLYDRVISNFMNKFGKKFGAKVEPVTLPMGEKEAKAEIYELSEGFAVDYNGNRKEFTTPLEAQEYADKINEAVSPQQSLPITPEMRKTATEEGIPLFQKEPGLFDEEGPTRPKAPPIATDKRAALDKIYSNAAAKKRGALDFLKSEKSEKDAKQGIISEILTPISTELELISSKLKFDVLRKFEFNFGLSVQDDTHAVIPFLKKYKKMSRSDQSIMDIALKNRDDAKVDELLKKYGFEGDRADLQKVMDGIYDRAKSVGLDVKYLGSYFPRKVIDAEGLVEAASKGEFGGLIDNQVKASEKKLGRPLSDMEKAKIADAVINAPDSFLNVPGAAKERTIGVIDNELNKFYDYSPGALVNYIHDMNYTIELRRLFGKGAQENPLVLDVNKSIGEYVLGLIEEGKLDAKKQDKVIGILRARFNYVPSGGMTRTLKNLGYLTSMGSGFSSFLSQLGDLAWAYYTAPEYATQEWGKSIIGKSAIHKEDLGIDRIAEEFRTVKGMDTVLKGVFDATLLTRMDSIGKDALINSAFRKYRALAKGNSQSLRVELERIFGDETDSVIESLKNGNMDDINVKYLLFNKLLDFQPVALSEMPKKYLDSPNGRIFYMLKTFTIKQLDVFRREGIWKIKNAKTAGERAKAIANLMGLVGLFIMANAGADELKDLLFGRKVTIKDRVIDNIFRLLGLSRFLVWEARRSGVASSIYKLITPPMDIIEAPVKDAIKTASALEKGEPVDVKNMESWKIIPFFGKHYYWWFGKGSQSQEKKEMKKINEERIKSLKKPEEFDMPPSEKIDRLAEYKQHESLMNHYKRGIAVSKETGDDKQKETLIQLMKDEVIRHRQAKDSLSQIEYENISRE